MSFTESNAQKIARKEIKVAIEGLLHACKNNNAAFYGYVWGTDPPLLVRFGNVKESGPDLTALILQLEDLANAREDAGRVLEDPIGGDGVGD